MDKRYQVFVSSTFEDLQDERREVMQALLMLKCIPTGMELFPAADEESTQVIKRFIADCDYYVLVVGGRYGSTLPNGKSYTEMEYEYALEAKLPVLAFLHEDPSSVPAKKTEQTDSGKAALAAFRKRVKDARHTKFWTSPKDLALAVYQGMSALLESKPRTGCGQIVRRTRVLRKRFLGYARRSTNWRRVLSRPNSPPRPERRGSPTARRQFLFILDISFMGGTPRTPRSLPGTRFCRSLGPSLLFKPRRVTLRRNLPSLFKIGSMRSPVTEPTAPTCATTSFSK